MEGWLEGIPTVLAVAGASVACSAAALAIAKALGLHRPRNRPVTSESPDSTIDRLAALADLARAKGLLAAEGAIDPKANPLLALGLSLAVDGIHPSEMTAKLDEALDARIARPSQVGRWMRAVRGNPSLLAATGAAVLLIEYLVHASNPGATPGLAAGLTMLLCFGSIAACGTVSRATLSCNASEALVGLFEVLAIKLIRENADGARVRVRLQGLLPAQSPDRASLAQAA